MFVPYENCIRVTALSVLYQWVRAKKGLSASLFIYTETFFALTPQDELNETNIPCNMVGLY